VDNAIVSEAISKRKVQAHMHIRLDSFTTCEKEKMARESETAIALDSPHQNNELLLWRFHSK